MMETEAAVQNETKASSGKKIIKLSGKLKPKELSYIVKLGTGLALASLVVMIGLAVFLFWGPDLIAQTTTFVRVLLITFAFLFVVSVLSVFNPLLHSIILQRSQVAEAKFEVQDIIREQIALQQQIKVLQEKNKEIEAVDEHKLSQLELKYKVMVQNLGLAETGQRKLSAVSPAETISRSRKVKEQSGKWTPEKQ